MRTNDVRDIYCLPVAKGLLLGINIYLVSGRGNQMKIRDYQDSDEKQWLFCRNVSLMDTAYFDDIYTEKEKYENDAIELIAELNGQIIGILDAEIEQKPRQCCSSESEISAMIWSIGVLEDHRRKGIASSLFSEFINRLKEKEIKRIEAWTRDDAWVQNWYGNMGFKQFQSYWHVYLNSTQTLRDHLPKEIEPVGLFCYCDNNNINFVKENYDIDRIHECVGYEYEY